MERLERTQDRERIGVIDTMFARVDMGAIAQEKLATMDGYGESFHVLRRTVPGMKDLAVAGKQLIERGACSIVIACGMPGPAELDQICAHEASQGIMLAQVLTGVHILEVFVHMSEELDPHRFLELCRNRVEGHAVNAYWMLYAPEELSTRAGLGIRQGAKDAGALLTEAT
ncbi:MAG: riboflavin synthase [Candidatus Dormibacteraeota bacterium]|nr:riboflavin synthase [Candidatus Dormibacteraeota bacterium]